MSNTLHYSILYDWLHLFVRAGVFTVMKYHISGNNGYGATLITFLLVCSILQRMHTCELLVFG